MGANQTAFAAFIARNTHALPAVLDDAAMGDAAASEVAVFPEIAPLDMVIPASEAPEPPAPPLGLAADVTQLPEGLDAHADAPMADITGMTAAQSSGCPSAGPAATAEAGEPVSAPQGLSDVMTPAPVPAAAPASAAPAPNAASLPATVSEATPEIILPARPDRLAADVGIEIARQVIGGKSDFSIRLDPPDLGRIDVRLELAPTGEVRGVIAADNPATHDLLRRDEAALLRLLTENGLKADSGALAFERRDSGS
ncbi:MAG: flagellar hook-length control protein FliK, partial [Pseudomonadota bacterium]